MAQKMTVQARVLTTTQYMMQTMTMQQTTMRQMMKMQTTTMQARVLTRTQYYTM
jgi:hypothetical protein